MIVDTKEIQVEIGEDVEFVESMLVDGKKEIIIRGANMEKLLEVMRMNSDKQAPDLDPEYMKKIKEETFKMWEGFLK